MDKLLINDVELLPEVSLNLLKSLQVYWNMPRLTMQELQILIARGDYFIYWNNKVDLYASHIPDWRIPYHSNFYLAEEVHRNYSGATYVQGRFINKILPLSHVEGIIGYSKEGE